MKVILLCGGMGTRLKEETEFKPKPMVYIGGKPLIWHIMKYFEYWGFNQFVLALGYKGEMIKDYFLNKRYYESNFRLKTNTKYLCKFERSPSADNFDITFVDSGLETPTGGRILACMPYIKSKHFIVSYSDCLSDVNLNKLVEFQKEKGLIGTMLACHPKSKYGKLCLDTRNNTIKRIIEKPVLHDWVNGGCMIFNKDFFKYLKEDEMDFVATNKLARDGQLAYYKHEGFWYAMDTFKEYEELNKIWANSPAPPWKIWK